MKYPIARSLAMARKRRSSQGSSLNAKLTAVNPDERRRIFLYLPALQLASSEGRMTRRNYHTVVIGYPIH